MVVFFYALLSMSGADPWGYQMILYLAPLPMQVMATYFLVYYQLPRLLMRKRYVLFLLSVMASFYALPMMARLCTIYVVEPLTRVGFEQEPVSEVLTDLVYLISNYFPVVYVYPFLLLALKAIKDRYQEMHRSAVLEKEKAENELKFLKAQIHPHFLFNTLNSLYALTLTKSDLAPEVVLKLSELLDYMLYQTTEKRVPIAKEVKLMQNYLELEQLRYGERLQLKFHQAVDQPGTSIAPMILLGLVENAFKHGASKNPNQPEINIDLKVAARQLTFEVVNTVLTGELTSMDKGSNGIGLKNLNRQLELNYPDSYELKTGYHDGNYAVLLKINLEK